MTAIWGFGFWGDGYWGGPAGFDNLSFENPPGVGATLLSGAVSPFAITEESLFTITVAGITTSVVFLASDFVDISAATADEVAELISLRVPNLNAANDGGAIRLTSAITGEDVELQVQTGGVNDVLLFSTTATVGETYAGGAPFSWAVLSDVSSVRQYAQFADENGRPEEIFDGNDSWPTVTVSNDTSPGVFDLALIPTVFETFSGWSPTGVLTAFPAESATFLPSGDLFDGFEQGWGTPVIFAFTPAFLQAGVTDTLETGWGQTGAATYSAGAFDAGAQAFEDFEEVVLHTWVISVLTSAAGEWVTKIDGLAYPATVGGGASLTDTALAIASALSGAPSVTVTTSVGVVYITPLDYSIERAVSLVLPTGGQADVVSAKDFPANAGNWTGNDFNPFFV